MCIRDSYTQAMNGPWTFRWYWVDEQRVREETYPGLSESWSIIEPSINSTIANRNHLITCSMEHSSTDVGALYFKKDGPRLYLVGIVPKFEEKEEFKIPPRERWVPLLSVEEWNPLRSGKYYYQRQDRNYEVYDFWDGDRLQAGAGDDHLHRKEQQRLANRRLCRNRSQRHGRC